MSRATACCLALSALLLALPAAGAEPDWSVGEPRPFLAGRAEAGSALHLQGIAGWGKPWWIWGGAAVEGWANADVGIVTAGLQGSLLAVDLDLHWRLQHDWTRVPMAPAASHGGFADGGGSTYQAIDASASGVIPLLGGYALWSGDLVRTLDAPTDMHVADEWVHAIIAPPRAAKAGLGWVADLRGGDLQLGGSVERVWTGRGGDPLVRLGPTISWSITGHWQLRGSVFYPVSSPDHLGWWPNLGGGLLIGWRDATGKGAPPRP